jgi:DNA-binding transcriptional ArsR family regulator
MASERDTSSTPIIYTRRSSHIERLIDQFLDAACDSSRRSILEMLIPPIGHDSPNRYELRAGEIARQLDLAPSTTSEHLRHLERLQLLNARKEGTAVYYRLRNHHLVQAFHQLLLALETHYQPSGSNGATKNNDKTPL